MGHSENHPEQNLFPDACTLSTAERPLRRAAFDGLFTEAVRGAERVGPERLRLELEARPQVAGQAAELVATETECCSFFTFVLTASASRLGLEVIVPPGYTGVLDALARRVTEVKSAAG